MMYTINIKRLLFYFLPPVKRYLPSGEIMLRVRWWHYLFSPVMGLITQYDIRRKKQMLQANTTSEAAVFEHYLREVCQDASIEVHYPGGHGIYAGNETDTFPRGVYVSNVSEDQGVYVGLPGTAQWQIIYDTADPAHIKKEMSVYLFSGLQCDVQPLN